MTARSNPVSLLDLPLEIREQIYEYALVASAPLEVYGRHYLFGPLIDDARRFPGHNITETSYFQGISTALIMVCRTTAQEASRYFYTKNTFGFLGDHEYKQERLWLQTIGRTNRGYLTSLSIEVGPLSRVWQLPDGTREGRFHGFVGWDNFHARHPLLQRPERTFFGDPISDWQDGIVEDIDPDLEAVFSILGNSRAALCTPVTITLKPWYGLWPGVNLTDEETMGRHYMGTDLPNLVGAWQVAYSIHRSLEVTWVIQDDTRVRTGLKKRLLKSGWLIVGTHQNQHGVTEAFLCKRRPHSSAIVADWDSEDINDTGRYCFDLAHRGEAGLYECEEGNAHRLGRECRCADIGWEGALTSLAPFQPIWPEMPIE